MRRLFSLLAAAAIGMGAATQASAQDLNGWFALQTMFQAPEGKCLEGNGIGPGSTLGGASFMAPCGNFTGQRWRFEPAQDGYYRMKTMSHGDVRCFEGNRVSRNSTLGGAAFMDHCQNVSGQLWRIIPDRDGYVRLTTMFLENRGKCLEGNRYAPDAFLGGAAFMADCQNVSGQLWILVPVN